MDDISAIEVNNYLYFYSFHHGLFLAMGPKFWLLWRTLESKNSDIVCFDWLIDLITQVVGVVKSCVPNGLGDLFTTLKVCACLNGTCFLLLLGL